MCVTEEGLFGLATAMTGTALDVFYCTAGSPQHSPGSGNARKGPVDGHSLSLLPVQAWQLYWAECASAVVPLAPGMALSFRGVGLSVQEQDSAFPFTAADSRS